MNFNSVFGTTPTVSPENPAAVESARKLSDVAEVGAALTGMPRGEAKVMAYFMALGVQQSEIIPRVNVLTFDGWKQKGRIVKKGSHGCTLTVFKRFPKKMPDGTEKTITKPWYYTVFWIGQTVPIEQKEVEQPVDSI